MAVRLSVCLTMTNQELDTTMPKSSTAVTYCNLLRKIQIWLLNLVIFAHFGCKLNFQE